MSDFKQKDFTGALFKIEGEKAEPWHDDFRGTALIGGVEYWCGLAKKTSKDGATYLKLNFRPKVAKEAGPRPALDDAVPFAPEFR